ncbi:MAG: 3-hydroxyacyl-CoA dehydrogenase/enoyl-CoA hydratase family protein [Myxococcota bacterium]
MSRPIRRVAVLGAGVMGSGIAAHLANAGIDSVLFDIVPKDAGSDAASRNAYALRGIQTAIKLKPAPLYKKDLASHITPANYDDHAHLLADCDWIIEVVVERLDIKKHVYGWVAEHRSEGSIVTSNTSGIPLASMCEDMPEEMRRHFMVTHFFNPVRYMRLLELVTGPETDPAVADALATFGRNVLGKGIVFGKDTVNFIANRIGTFGMGATFAAMTDLGMTVEQVDKTFGENMGFAKSAVYRTADVVGLDTLAHVMTNVYENVPDDERRDAFLLPTYLTSLVEKGALGQKSGAGFYKKTKVDGRKTILVLDVETGEYRAQEKVRFPCIGEARKQDTLKGRVNAMVWGAQDDLASRLAWRVTAETLIYSANRIPEIADDIINIDRAMRWGFGRAQGPFETWDTIGVPRAVERMKAEGMTVPAWVDTMLASGRETFYARDASGHLTQYNADGTITPVDQPAEHVFLADITSQGNTLVERNVSASIHDMGDGIALLEFHSKMNAIDEGIIAAYTSALDRMDAGEFEGLVVGNEAPKAFCAGANLLMIVQAAMAQEWDQIDQMISTLQALMHRAKYSRHPVVTAPHALALGGGCEIAMQATHTVANGELYMGLVEVGVGLIPGAGGCKELAVRYLGDVPAGVDADPQPHIKKVFERIAMANVSTSAMEAQSWGYLRPTDTICLDSDARLQTAKRIARGLATAAVPPAKPREIMAAGPGCKAAIEAFLQQMVWGGYATEHDALIGGKLAHVLTGGDVPAGTMVSEERLLELEREAFLSLCGEQKSLERIGHMLTKNKPLRN